MSLKSKALSALKRVTKIPGRVVDKAIERDKKIQGIRRDKNWKMMMENYGSQSNYEKAMKKIGR